VPSHLAIEALGRFGGVKRRMELRGEVAGIAVFDDFAHHPTAIRTTLDGLRARSRGGRILAILEPRSNTMRMGLHRDQLAPALEPADQVFVFTPEGLRWDPVQALVPLGSRLHVLPSVAGIVEQVAAQARPGDRILVMSNGGFENIHPRLLEALARRYPAAPGP
jgi:UDP-N-acetylmuramate: L-alanyl-gamma-D-glutamyl-meso-diaminopimelate ligase